MVYRIYLTSERSERVAVRCYIQQQRALASGVHVKHFCCPMHLLRYILTTSVQPGVAGWTCSSVHRLEVCFDTFDCVRKHGNKMKRCNDCVVIGDATLRVAMDVTGNYSSISALLSGGSWPNFVRESRETRRKLGERSKKVTNCKQMLLSLTLFF